MSDCLFCKIVAGEIPSDALYEDDDLMAFWDISPNAPKHFLVIPKKHIVDASDIREEDEKVIGKMMRIAAQVFGDGGWGLGVGGWGLGIGGWGLGGSV